MTERYIPPEQPPDDLTHYMQRCSELRAALSRLRESAVEALPILAALASKEGVFSDEGPAYRAHRLIHNALVGLAEGDR